MLNSNPNGVIIKQRITKITSETYKSEDLQNSHSMDYKNLNLIGSKISSRNNKAAVKIKATFKIVEDISPSATTVMSFSTASTIGSCSTTRNSKSPLMLDRLILKERQPA